MESFNQHLSELERLFQDDDNTMGEQLAASGALCCAARVGSIPMMDALIQKGAGEALYQHSNLTGPCFGTDPNNMFM